MTDDGQQPSAEVKDPVSDPAAASLDDFSLDDEPIGARLGRRWTRAKTDLIGLSSEIRGHYWRLDLFVIVAALVLAAGASLLHRHLVEAPTETVKVFGLTFRRTAAWLAAEPVVAQPPRIAPGTPPPKLVRDALPYHVSYTSSLDPETRLEIRIDRRPPWSNLLTGLELDRRNRWGELYRSEAGRSVSIAGHDWLRTPFNYGYVAEKGDEPRIGRALELATVDRESLYVVTFHGRPAQLAALEAVVAPSLRVPSRTGMPLLPQSGRLAARAPSQVASAFASTVMVVVADIEDGYLRAKGGGSGIIVSGDGSILTNFHVVHDRDGRLHDVFVIGRHLGEERPPELVCAGRPNRGKLQPELDLALIKCDVDLDGMAWNPTQLAWPVAAERRREPVSPGQRLWAIGFPDVGGGSATVSQGLVEGWTGEDGGLGRDYIKTDASITHGSSGGPVVDDEGRVVGIATAFRLRVSATGGTVETAKVGLVRPFSAASDLVAIARAGWLPREGHSLVTMIPGLIADAPSEGIHISTRIVDAANDRPIDGALLMVLRRDVSIDEVDMNSLDKQVLAWGKSNRDGEVHVRQLVPAPGSYAVLVIAGGYEPLRGDNVLVLAEDAPPYFDPWGGVRLEAR